MTHNGQNGNDNGTALAVRSTESLERFGDRAHIREMFDRIKRMIPGAANAPDAVVMAAAQKAVAHGLDVLDDEIYLMEVKGRWTAHVGIRGLRRNADGKYMFEESDDYPRRLTDEEIEADHGKKADPGIIGIEVRMYNLVKARECKELGIPYFPRKERGYWFPGDRVPATRTAAWVAQKRAEKMALRAEFALEFTGQASEDEAIEEIEWKLRQEDRRTALPVTPRGNMDDDIDELWAQAQAGNGAPTAQDAPDEPEDGEYRELDAEAADNPWEDDSEALTPATADNDAPSQAELTIIGDWSTPADAHAWAVEHGHCENAHHAQKRFANVVREQFDNKLSKQNMAAVMLAFLRACSTVETATKYVSPT